jgi:hypothetical protein
MKEHVRKVFIASAREIAGDLHPHEPQEELQLRLGDWVCEQSTL